MIDCKEIAFAIGLSPEGSSCICENNFVWNPVEYLCVIDCSSLANDPLGLKENLNSYECACPANTKWILDARRC